MKPFIPTLAALGAVLALGACTTYGYGGGYGGDRYARGYDAYYDDAYGPYYSGYWGSDGVYMYARERGGPMLRDEDHHFRRDAGDGFHGIRSSRGERGPG